MTFQRRIGRGIRRAAGQMNKLEIAYQAYLLGLQYAGQVLWFEYEAVKFKLGKATFYTPDFMVLMADLSLEVHEVKGRWEDWGRIKIKCAAEKYPLRFIGIQRVKGQWAQEHFSDSEQLPSREETP